MTVSSQGVSSVWDVGVAAWERARNEQDVIARWQFTAEDALKEYTDFLHLCLSLHTARWPLLTSLISVGYNAG